MAWIRLDDQIAHHPKTTKAGLSSWLWVCCIGFSQKFLTDGHIPSEVIASIAGGIERPQNHIKKLVKVGLLEKVTGGYQVHDYLTFNDSAETVRRKREQDRVRKLSERSPNGIPTESERNPESVLARAPASHPIPSHPIPISKVKDKAILEGGAATTGTNGNGGANTTDRGRTNRTTNTATTTVSESTARSKRPIYQSDRFVVFEWQFDDLGRLLGSHLDAFDLHAFFDALSKQSREAGLIIPQRDSGAWLQNQVLTEAQRRGLPIATTEPADGLSATGRYNRAQSEGASRRIKENRQARGLT